MLFSKNISRLFIASVAFGLACAADVAAAPALTLSSEARDNVFLADSGQMRLKLDGFSGDVAGTVVVTDEYGDERERLPVSGNPAEIVIELPSKGYYHLAATVKDADGNVQQAEASAAVIGAALSDEERMQSFLGLWNVHGDKEMVAAAGARFNRRMTAIFKYDRDFLRYADPSVKPEKPVAPSDEPEFSDIGVISFGLPMWMLDPEDGKGKHSFGNPTRAPEDWDELKTLVKSFANNPPWPSFPKYFEIYNEPEWQWEGSDEDFVRFLATIADGIKEARPDTQVLGPGFSQPRLKTSNRIGLIDAERLGLFEHLDGIVVHCYVDGSEPEGEFIQNIIDLKNFLVETGHGDMPIHFTEFGWTSYPGTWQRPVDELTQARYLVRSLALLATQDAASAIYFCYIFSGNGKLGEQGFSIAHMDGTPKPAYAAYSHLARWVAGAEGPFQWLRLTPGTHMVLFGRDGGSSAILWDAHGQSEFTLPGRPARIEDMVGRSLPIPADGKLTLSPSPVFVSWEQVNGTELRQAPALTLMRGNGVELPATAESQWLIPAPLSVSGRELSAPATAPVGPYLLLAQGADGWQAQPVEVIAPLKLESPRLNWPADRAEPLLTAAAESYATVPLKVRAAAAVRDLRSFFADPMEVEPDEAVTIEVPLSGLTLGHRYRGEFEVVSQSPGQRDRLAQPFEFTLLACEPVGDDEPDWEKIPAVDFTQWAPFGGPVEVENCSATLQSAYGSDGLYLRVQVRDDHHVQGASAENMWSQDAIQIGIDLDIDKPWSANEFYGLKGHRVFEYGVGGQPGEEMTWRWISYLPELPAGQGEPRMDLEISREADVTTYDILFPWETLGADASPGAGGSIGIALAVSDVDPGTLKERRVLRLFNGIIDSKDPERFGRLWLR
ncbi:hypothetical protein H5P28_13735 [Ruficoccus amylovorans]|uniref:Carbohydrate-binding domain-containing protein n=1 Tax=Ruficoccus amylovorans TaxID=1804625 RepID=A0A842HID0_9BACT|nr:sugar-binding protein [Ruficoccus amylovorans]MBC2595324.1 hypothetical protein [Ruficoccus amylovorans]